MRYGKTMTTATILTALLAAAPFTAGAQSKMDETKDKAKTMTRTPRPRSAIPGSPPRPRSRSSRTSA